MWEQLLILLSIAAFAFSHLLDSNPSEYISRNGAQERLDHPFGVQGYKLGMTDLLGLSDRIIQMKKQPSLRNSASKFLLDVYNEISQDDEEPSSGYRKRHKRSPNYDSNFITEFEREEMERCNNIITFSSKVPKWTTNETAAALGTTNLHIVFNTNDVPRDLKLVHSTLRIYQDPALSRYQNHKPANSSISVYQRIPNRKQGISKFKIFTTINATTMYKGWLEFNMTTLLSKWLQYRTLHQVIHGNEILVRATLRTDSELIDDVASSDLGLVGPHNTLEDLRPFIVGYFWGPELMAKLEKLRFKRAVIKNRHNAYVPQPPPLAEEYRQPEMCQRVNFTLDFRDLHMHNFVIAPKQFEAYFCGGGCNFPLGSKMNATNHAIVQTLMHLRQPNLPKACCVPTKLGSISILYYLTEDSVNLSKYPQSVAKECGCH